MCVYTYNNVTHYVVLGWAYVVPTLTIDRLIIVSYLSLSRRDTPHYHEMAPAPPMHRRTNNGWVRECNGSLFFSIFEFLEYNAPQSKWLTKTYLMIDWPILYSKIWCGRGSMVRFCGYICAVLPHPWTHHPYPKYFRVETTDGKENNNFLFPGILTWMNLKQRSNLVLSYIAWPAMQCIIRILSGVCFCYTIRIFNFEL